MGNRQRPAARFLALAVLLLVSPGMTFVGANTARAESPIQLTDVTAQTGITFTHTDGGSGRRYIMETVTAGLALFDFDNDGDIDIYFLNGAPLRGAKADKPPRNALYRNDGGFHFVDVTETAGVGDTGFGLGVAVGDYDNDGDQDLYVNNFGPNVMYRNNGNGTFTDVTKQTGTADGPIGLGAGACFLDADKDGDLDLYVSRYLEFSYDRHVDNMWLGYHVYPGPEQYEPTADALYRNNGNGTFTDVSDEAGITSAKGHGMGIVCADYDNDGDTDVFVGNDSTANFLFENDGTGKFTEAGLISGFGFDLYGNRQASMGVDCGDFDNDGLLDFYQTSYQGQFALLFKNLGGGRLEDVTLTSGAGQGTQQHVTWGIGVVDFDNDGDRDIFVACGHLMDNVDEFTDVTSYKVRNLLLANNGRGKFTNVSRESGNGMLPKESSRGAAFDDLDNDGDVDCVILNSRRPPTILRNDSPTANHWLDVRLRGTQTNRDGVGAHVRVITDDLTQLDEVHSGRSYQSHYGTRLHFGLGQRTKINRVEVRWIGGGTDSVREVPVDRRVTITEGGKLVIDK